MDLAILSSHIFTGNPQHPWAEALAIRGNRIDVIGENHAVKSALDRSKTRILELPGRLITPGLVDAHCHFGSLGASLTMINLDHQPSLDSCRENISKEVKNYKPGDWILGKGWNQHQWENGGEPTLKDLDDLTPNNPAMMIRVCGHTVWVNSFALKLAGISQGTPDPPGGRIERDPDTGKPNGLLRESRELIERVMPKPSLEDWKVSVLAAQKTSLSFGLTGVHTMEGLTQWRAMRSLENEGKLKVRVHHCLPVAYLDKASEFNLFPGYGTDRLWIGHIKLFADGSLGSATALLHEPYHDNPSQTGIQVTSMDEMEKGILQAYNRGYDVAIHSIGDKATTNSLRAIAKAREKNGHHRNPRDRIEHVQLLRQQDIPLFKALNVAASVQPVFLPTDWSVAESKWGHERCRRGGYAWKTIGNAGIPMLFGSDAPVESINPLMGLHAAAARCTVGGKPEGGWHPEQKLTLEEGIKGFTQIPAWSARKEDKLGTIAVGKWADLTIFERDLFHVPVSEWPSTEVEMTIIDGEIVYQQ